MAENRYPGWEYDEYGYPVGLKDNALAYEADDWAQYMADLAAQRVMRDADDRPGWMR